MRICIVEDDPGLLANLSLLLGGEPGLAVLGAHPSAEAALAGTDFGQIDVLLADIDLPGLSGVDLIRAVKERSPAVNCLAYTISEDRATVFSAIKAGACGYLLKGASPRQLVESIREIHEGGAPMSPRIARRLLLGIQESHGDAPVERALLSPREIEILRRLERGLSYKEIGAALHISAHTVHSHIKSIYEKVHARTRQEALRTARHLGVL